MNEFLALPESPERLELVEGEILMNPRPVSDHQEMILHLGFLLRGRTGGEGRLIPEKEMIVDVGDGKERVRCPDLVYVRSSRQAMITARAIEGPADIAIEVLSELSQEIDRITKRNEYRACGVREYWIVDLIQQTVTVHDFAADTHLAYSRGECFDSPVLLELGLPARFGIDEVFAMLSPDAD